MTRKLATADRNGVTIDIVNVDGVTLWQYRGNGGSCVVYRSVDQWRGVASLNTETDRYLFPTMAVAKTAAYSIAVGTFELEVSGGVHLTSL